MTFMPLAHRYPINFSQPFSPILLLYTAVLVKPYVFALLFTLTKATLEKLFLISFNQNSCQSLPGKMQIDPDCKLILY